MVMRAATEKSQVLEKLRRHRLSQRYCQLSRVKVKLGTGSVGIAQAAVTALQSLKERARNSR